MTRNPQGVQALHRPWRRSLVPSVVLPTAPVGLAWLVLGGLKDAAPPQADPALDSLSAICGILGLISVLDWREFLAGKSSVPALRSRP